MRIDRIKSRVSDGFKPFVLCLSDGQRIPVPHPEFVAFGQKVIVVVGSNDKVNTIDPLHVVTVEDWS